MVMPKLKMWTGRETPPLPVEHPEYKPPGPEVRNDRVIRRRKASQLEAPIVSHFDPCKYARVREAALLLGVGEHTVRNYIRRGVLGHAKLFGKYVLVPLEDVLELCAERRKRLREEYERAAEALLSMDEAQKILETSRLSLASKGSVNARTAYNIFFENQIPKDAGDAGDAPDVKDGVDAATEGGGA